MTTTIIAMRSFRTGLSVLACLVLAICFIISYKYLFVVTRQRLTTSVDAAAAIHARPRPLNVNVTDMQRRNMFHCDLPELSCLYFELDRFLEKQGLTLDQVWGSTNSNLPAITSLTLSNDESNETRLPESAAPKYLPVNINFIHIHKCGGSTVKAIFQALRKQQNTEISSYQGSFGSTNAEKKLEHERLRQEHIESLSYINQQPIVFTIIRDPVDRFLSAIQQVMHYHDDLRAKCLLSTATATIQCVLFYMQSHAAANDVHFLPMLSHLRLLEGVRIAVFTLEHLDLLSSYFIGRTLRIRDRSDTQTATSAVLAKMSAKDCTDDIIQAICHLYAVDVGMMTSLGLGSKYC